jgi:hypothetical protein
LQPSQSHYWRVPFLLFTNENKDTTRLLPDASLFNVEEIPPTWKNQWESLSPSHN